MTCDEKEEYHNFMPENHNALVLVQLIPGIKEENK